MLNSPAAFGVNFRGIQIRQCQLGGKECSAVEIQAVLQQQIVLFQRGECDANGRRRSLLIRRTGYFVFLRYFIELWFRNCCSTSAVVKIGYGIVDVRGERGYRRFVFFVVEIHHCNLVKLMQNTINTRIEYYWTPIGIIMYK